jgi:hypothetical protein
MLIRNCVKIHEMIQKQHSYLISLLLWLFKAITSDFVHLPNLLQLLSLLLFPSSVEKNEKENQICQAR